MIGSTIGSYRVVRLLGEGGMGSVYEGVNESIERRVAIKVLHSEYARRPEVLSRFFNEARAVNRIAHPSIVQIHEHGHMANGVAYIVMEYLEGQTLGERLHRMGGKLPLRIALQIAWQMAAALASAHEKHIVHRDLKPGNLMLVPDPLGPGGERVKLLDFGIAKLAADTEQDNKTASQLIMGTPTYMSPEQCRGAGMVDEKTDIYSLGVILYEMLAGQPPFVSDGPGDLMAMHMFRQPAPLSQLAPDVPSDIAAYVEQMLRKEKTQRPAMREVFDRFSELATGYAAVSKSAAHEATRMVMAPRARDSDSTAFISEHSTLGPRGQRQARGQRRLLPLVVPVFLVATAGMALWYFAFRTPESTPVATKRAPVLDASKAAGPEASPPREASAAVRPEKGRAAQGGPPQRRPQMGNLYGGGGVRPAGAAPLARPKLNPAQVERQLQAAQEEYVKGNYRKTIEIAKPVENGSPLRAWRILGSAACNIKDVRLANEAFRRLDVSGRKYLASVCGRNGILNLGTLDQTHRIVD
jgi:hypothetical protein